MVLNNQDCQAQAIGRKVSSVKRLEESTRFSVSEMIAHSALEAKWPLGIDVQSSVETRIIKCKDVLSGLDRTRGMDGDVAIWLENEALEIRADAINEFDEMRRRIGEMVPLIEKDLEEVMLECRRHGIIESEASAHRVIHPFNMEGGDAGRSISLASTQSSISTKQRIEDWKLSKSQKKESEEREKAAQRRQELRALNQNHLHRLELRKMVLEYRKQERDEHESESRAAVSAHLAEIKLRQDQYVSLGISERVRTSTLKILERRKVQPSPVKKLVCSRPTSSTSKPSKLYHPTKSSLHRSSASILSDSPTPASPQLFMPYLSRYSMN